MSDALFPKLAGLTFEIKASPTFSTVVQKPKNRSRIALLNDPYPLWTFDLTYDFIRDSPLQRPGAAGSAAQYTELEQIVGFFCAHAGKFDDFLLDPGMLTGRQKDWEVRGGRVGTGDGTTTAFYLQRNVGGFLDEVQNPVGAVVLTVNGLPQPTGAWTLAPGGVVNFAAAPPANAAITWDGRWRYRVCFAEDAIDLDQFMYELYELKSLKLEEVKL